MYAQPLSTKKRSSNGSAMKVVSRNLGAKPYFRLPSKMLYGHVKMRIPVLLRWFPDIIAVFPPLAFLIDAKQGARHRDTGKHAIEQSSLKAILILEKALNISAWFILPVEPVFQRKKRIV